MVGNLKGLTSDEVFSSREKYGDNSLEAEKTKGFFRKFFENLSDPIIKVLLIAVALQIVFTFPECNWLETAGIVIAVMIATTVSTVSEFGSERAFLKMQEANCTSEARVIREGKVLNIPVSEIVVGDLICASSGEAVYADGNIISGRLIVDQSALNGESAEALKVPSKKDEKNDLSSASKVFRGSIAIDGSAIIHVERVGKDTFYGMVAKDIQVQTRESPLKHRLSKLASTISKIGYLMAVIVGLTYLFYTFIVENDFERAKILASFSDIPYVVSNLTHALTLMITVVVVAVPEGLPMMITVVLSANMKRMLDDNVMVKKLVGIETAGSMNILFTDKTGTLTTGKTSVSSVITSSGEYSSCGALKKEHTVYDYINACAKLSISGTNAANSTDKAISAFFADDITNSFEIKSFVPFSSDKKYSSVTLSDGTVVKKGAPEIILNECSLSIDKEGNVIGFDKSRIFEKYRECASFGGRVIAVSMIKPNGESIFLALMVLKDKLRKGVKAAVKKMRDAGVSVVMITGDGKETAESIARECGIVCDADQKSIITADELSELSDEELKNRLPYLKVVARALPRDKTRLVRISQELNMVVGMTGDGINDAPSLKLADVGFAMGSGTDIAKSAGDIVILDNSFMSITKTVLYGRTIFKSIRKFISFQLMMNLAACGISLIGQFIGFENPITIIQMLWINIIMDTLGGLAFAGEAPQEYYMLEKPMKRDEQILSGEMLHQILLTGAYTLFLCALFLKLDFFRSLFSATECDAAFLTGFYALFVFSGLFNCFNSRSERMSILSNIEKNKPFIVIMLLISCIQILMIYFGGEVFRCVPLSFRELLNVVLISSTVILFDVVRRVVKKLK